MSSIINHAKKNALMIIKAQMTHNRNDLPEITQRYVESWDKAKNDAFFDEHPPIGGLIATAYPAINHIIELFGVKVTYRKVDDPHTIINPFASNYGQRIFMPHPNAFASPERYAAVLSHELGHATQVPLNRYLIDEKNLLRRVMIGDSGRSQEEIVAEMVSLKIMEMVGVYSDDYASIYMASNLLNFNPMFRDAAIEGAEKYANEAFKYLVSLGG